VPAYTGIEEKGAAPRRIAMGKPATGPSSPLRVKAPCLPKPGETGDSDLGAKEQSPRMYSGLRRYGSRFKISS